MNDSIRITSAAAPRQAALPDRLSDPLRGQQSWKYKLVANSYLKILRQLSKSVEALSYCLYLRGGSSNDSPDTYSKMAEWQPETRLSLIEPPLTIQLDSTTRLYRQLNRGDVAACQDWALLHSSPLTPQTSASGPIILAPIFDQHLMGFLLLVDTAPRRQWSEHELKLTQLCASSLSVALLSVVDPDHELPYASNIYDRVEDAPDLIWSMDPQGRWGLLSASAEKIFGYSLDAMLGKPFMDFQTGAQSKHNHFLFTALRMKQKLSRLEVRFTRSNGEALVLLLNAIPLLDRDGRLTGASGTAIDISRIKKAIHALRDSELHYQTAIHAANDTLWDWNLRTNQVWIDEPQGATPKPVSVALREKLRKIHPHDRKRVTDSIRETFQQRQTDWSYRYRFLGGGNHYSDVMARAHIVYDRQGWPLRMIGAMLNLSELQQTEAGFSSSRKQFRELALQLQAAREEERSIIARELHDEFAQVLTAIKLDLHWLQRKLPPQEGALHARIDDMTSTVEQTMQRVWDRTADLRPRILEDMGLAGAIQWQLNKFNERTGSVCNSQTEALKRCRFNTDLEIALYRIVQEALANIARHTDATQVQVTSRLHENHLELCIADNGPGLPPGKVYDANSLGLAGMRERAGVFGGGVFFESPAGGGTTVTIRVPL